MKKILLLPVALVVFGAPALVQLQAARDHKVVICHIPPGNPANAHEIEVDFHAVPAHLDHGDNVGSCGGGEVPQ